jgi:hypothetical protein
MNLLDIVIPVSSKFPKTNILSKKINSIKAGLEGLLSNSSKIKNSRKWYVYLLFIDLI